MICHCGIEFIKSGKQRKYHSIECQVAYQRRKPESIRASRESDKRRRESLPDSMVKKYIYIASKGGIKYDQMTVEMIEEKRQAVVAWRNKPIIIPKCNVYFPECGICNEIFTARRLDEKYCSDKCKMINHLKSMREKYKDEWQQPEPFKCKECGEIVIIEFGDARTDYCSELCRERHKSRNLNHKRRINKRENYIESVSISYICKRDNYRCHICRKKVNMKLKKPHLMSATLDHIVALADGGTHERKNIKLAHMICNSIKGAGTSLGGDQLRLYG